MSPHARRRDLLTLAGGAALGGLALAAPPTGAPLRVGQSLPLTGALAAVVRPMAEGQKALIDEVNAEGGIRGVPLELLTLDDGALPERTLDNTRRLVDTDRVAMLFGYAFVPGLARALPLINERRVPLLGVYNGADLLRGDANPYLFTTTASLHDEVTAMVRNLASLRTRRLAVVVQNNELGRFMQPRIEAIAAEHQATVAVSLAAEPDGSNAVALAQAVMAKEPEAILLLAAGQAVPGFMKALPPAARVAVYALSLAGTSALVEQLGPAARGMAFTQVVPHPGRHTSPLTRRFAAAMARAGLPASYDRLWGYLNALVLAEVLRRAGAGPTPGTVFATLERLGELDLGGYRLTFGPGRHHGSGFVEITIVDQNGKFVR